MKLELASFPVKDVIFGSQTSYSGGVLGIDKKKMESLVLEDKNIATASLDIAFPGEKTRIVLVRDAVEPRMKVADPGCVFPGVFGPVEPAGEGRTNRLSGIAVLVSADYTPTILSGLPAQSSGLVDMWGPASLMTAVGKTINVVLTIKLIEGISEWAAHMSIQQGMLKVANQLAQTTRDLRPNKVDTFELTEVDPSLPRVVYVLGWTGNEPENVPGPPTDAIFYGTPVHSLIPTLIHPNEILDGAITRSARCGSGDHALTWSWLNHPVVLQLFSEHGKRINFLGVILQKLHIGTEHDKQVAAVRVSQIARLLKADAAIIGLASIGGSNNVDMMMIVQACEKKNIKTVAMTHEWGGNLGTDAPLIFYVPEATALVSVGTSHREIALPAPTKVIGAAKGQLISLSADWDKFSPESEVTIPRALWIAGGVDFWGELSWSGRAH
jgi:hypothetical protein